MGVSTSSPSVPHVLWTSTFHAFAAEQKLQEQSLFAEMEQEHEQVSTVNNLGCVMEMAQVLQVQLNEWMLDVDVVPTILQRQMYGALHTFEKCPWFMCNKDQLKVSGTKHEGYQLNHKILKKKNAKPSS